MTPESNSTSGVARTVLVVDDDPASTEVLADYLRGWGFEVDLAPDGVQAIKKIIARDYSFVLCDMVLPHLAGDIFYMAVSRARPALCKRFLFMTGHSNNPKIEAFIKDVNGTILMKPFTADALKNAIDRLNVR